MNIANRVLLAAVVIFVICGAVLADGMIVPVRPDLRVRGAWAVKYHHVNIKVREQVSAVSIDQEFINTGRGMIEVEYLFPVPPGAAIDSMTMVVDGKEFTAKLLDAKKARKIYEDIVRRKKDPALLEYAGFGLYKTRAFPLMPGKPCKVIVTYKNICKKDRDLVEVWYPLNTEKFSAKAIESVQVRVDIKSAADIGAVYSPTHSLAVDRKGPRHVIATYKAKKTLPTSDFQVFYKASNKKIGATFLTHQGDTMKDGYFMLLVSPNPRSSRDNIVPKDVVVVLDHSGSMSGKKIDQAKEALSYVLKNLNPEDRFNVVAYNDSVEQFYKYLVPVSKKFIADALDIADRIEASGGTNIHAALLAAMDCRPRRTVEVPIPKPGNRPRYVIFLTDGVATVGKTAEKDILDATKKANCWNARIFTFGIGYKPNIRLLDKLASQNNGRSDYVKPAEPIEAKVSSLYNKIKNPVMTNLAVSMQGVRLSGMYPRNLGDLFDGDQIVMVGRYDGRVAPAGRPYHATLLIKGVYRGRERAFEYNVCIRPAGRDIRYLFVEKIWAIRRVGYLLDQIQLHGKNKEVIDELIRLSKTYGIMTPYTSFLADETTVLHKPRALRMKGDKKAKILSGRIYGGEAQREAVVRRRLSQANIAPADSAAEGIAGKSSGVRMFGNTRLESYEKDKVEYVKGVRNVGNQAIYRRGRLWIASSASSVDMKKDASSIVTVKRFSSDYFKLIRKNTVHENQIMASQRDNEELLIKLRGRAYRIK